MALGLCVAGCFADPPSSGSGGEASTADATASSSTSSSDDTTSTGETSNDTSGAVDSSSGTSTGGECELFPAAPPLVPADIAVIIDTDVPTDAVVTALNTLSGPELNNLAIIVPDSIAASINVQVSCLLGCDMAECPANPNRVIVPYGEDESPYDTLEMFERFDCVFREPLPETSGPVSHLWFITQRPELMPPEELAALVLGGDLSLRVHVSCPECDEELLNANALLKQVVVDSGGTVSDYNVLQQVVAQLSRLGEQRLSCVWPTDADPSLLDFVTGGGNGFFAAPVPSFAACDADAVLDGGEGAFFPTNFGVALCPDTCRVVQAAPADAVAVSECF